MQDIHSCPVYGTAEAVPFVEGGFPGVQRIAITRFKSWTLPNHQKP